MSAPVPSLKSVIMSTVRPEIKALLDIYKDEISYMHQVLEQQNTILQQLHDVMLFMQSSMASLIGYNSENMVEMQLRQNDVKYKADYVYMMTAEHMGQLQVLSNSIKDLKNKVDSLIEMHQNS